jgi:hypothetical protein
MTTLLNRTQTLGSFVAFAVPAFITVAMLAFTVGL